jgi:chemotaxis protein methyltransferase CheR
VDGSNVDDSQCVTFLQETLPRLGLRWAGFRKVRGQVCKRLRRRVSELGLPNADAYRAYLGSHPEEWATLDSLTHITISRFNRDRGVFARLERDVVPTLAGEAMTRGSGRLEAWSAGCASGEEAYTLAIIWQLALAQRFPTLALRTLATDVDEAMLARARRGCYAAASLREVPERWRDAAFVQRERCYCVREEVQSAVRIVRHDIRDPAPEGPFDLVMCRNLAFTYFESARQLSAASRVAGALRPRGALVVGKHETLPAGVEQFEPWNSTPGVYRRVGGRAAA